MNKTNRDNLGDRFDAGEDLLDYFETGVVLDIHRLKEISAVFKLSALARKAGINPNTLKGKSAAKSLPPPRKPPPLSPPSSVSASPPSLERLRCQWVGNDWSG